MRSHCSLSGEDLMKYMIKWQKLTSTQTMREQQGDASLAAARVSVPIARHLEWEFSALGQGRFNYEGFDTERRGHVMPIAGCVGVKITLGQRIPDSFMCCFFFPFPIRENMIFFAGCVIDLSVVDSEFLHLSKARSFIEPVNPTSDPLGRFLPNRDVGMTASDSTRDYERRLCEWARRRAGFTLRCAAKMFFYPNECSYSPLILH